MPKTRKNRRSGTRRTVMKKLKNVGSVLDKIGFWAKKGTIKMYKKGSKVVMQLNKSF